MTASPRSWFSLMGLAAFSLSLGITAGRAANAQEDGCFVARQGTEFQLNGCPYRVTGTNQYYQMIHRRGADRLGVNDVLDEMVVRGMNVLRTWAFQDDASRSDCLQCAPSTQLPPPMRPSDFMNEATFRGLDELLDQASARDIRVILTLVNNWNDFGGMRQYTIWRFGGAGAGHDAFYNDAIIRGWFKDYVSLLVNRVNHVNGRRYGDDPTIFAWELTNEARCSNSGCSTQNWINSWILEMSCYIKSIDSNHLVATGIEGFYGPARAAKNPDSWMSQQGTDFIDNHLGRCIDFATVHVWPQNWGWDPIHQTAAALGLAEAYTLHRLADGVQALGKPVVLEEFGVVRDNASRCGGSGFPGPTTVRDEFYRLFYGLCEDSAAPGGSCAGALNWMVYDESSCSYDDGNGVFLPADASTDDIISGHAAAFGTCSKMLVHADSACLCSECLAPAGPGGPRAWPDRR